MTRIFGVLDTQTQVTRMDASAPSESEVHENKVYSFVFEDHNSEFTGSRQNRTIIKYTRLPDFDCVSRESWVPNGRTQTEPRLRRTATVEDRQIFATRSLRNEVPITVMASTVNRRKIVTITETDDLNTLQPEFVNDSQSMQKPHQHRKNVEAVKRIPTQKPRPSVRSHTSISKTNTPSKQSAKPQSEKKQLSETPKANSKTKKEYSKSLSVRKKEPTIVMQNKLYRTPTPRTSVSKKTEPPSKCIDTSKNKLTTHAKTNIHSISPKRQSNSTNTSPTVKAKVKSPVFTESHLHAVTVIRVPRDTKNNSLSKHFSKHKGTETDIKLYPTRKSCYTNTLDVHEVTDINKNCEKYLKVDEGLVKSAPPYTIDHDNNVVAQPVRESRVTFTATTNSLLPPADTNRTERSSQTVLKSTCDKQLLTEVDKNRTEKGSQTSLQSICDNLEIPKVTLRKFTSDQSKENRSLNSKSLPNLTPIKIVSSKNDVTKIDEKNVCNSSSFIIGRATVTYTTRQKIDFHVLSHSEQGKALSDMPMSSPLAYPLNVVSIFRKEISKHSGLSDPSSANNNNNSKENEKKESNMTMTRHAAGMNVKSLDAPLDSDKLVKPDVISTIRLDDGFKENGLMCEQFQRELNFINSFFESLQYLESGTLSGQCFAGNKVQNWVRASGFDVRDAGYDCLFPKIDDVVNTDDGETIAARSLCLLNLLIRDEQRRAKNLLFVLKMREDALKDFTKSQILWLENKKKQDHTDIPTLKKKQRGALLKLHHECGEMQRMRKALLALSEKRKVALLKTKKNIELKLNNNLNVNDILLNKKKLKRSTVADRNAVPLKCFDLSSSGCEELPRRTRSEPTLRPSAPSAEKSIQTGHSLLEPHTAVAVNNCVTVDGAYLNILFGNLSLPQIFSEGKQYEVNEKALRNIVDTDTSDTCQEVNDVDKVIDQIQCKDVETSSTPSTARSLVDELDQYYKGLVDEDKSPDEELCHSQETKQDIDNVQTEDTVMLLKADGVFSPVTPSSVASSEITGKVVKQQALEYSGVEQVSSGTERDVDVVQEVTASLSDRPRPTSPQQSDDSATRTLTGGSEDSGSGVTLSPPGSALVVGSGRAVSAPALVEAEELRRQQLAIEREIKALEQQQSELLVVREIPDKPPPPYTPPVETRTSFPTRFAVDETIEQRVREHILRPTDTEPKEALDMFVKDFCVETVDNMRTEASDKPWDACNLLPPQKQLDLEALVAKTATELKNVLGNATTSVPGGVLSGYGGGARRSDHVDEILFAEWRRREGDWTALHTGEAAVKAQLFETIFQRILDETVDEYKRVVLGTTRGDS